MRKSLFFCLWFFLACGVGTFIPTKAHAQCSYQNQPKKERIGVLRSTGSSNKGMNWQFMGYACFPVASTIPMSSAMVPVDPSPLALGSGKVALYFLDINTLSPSSGSQPRVMYRADTTDPSGLNFSTPMPVYTQNAEMTDPTVVRRRDGKYLMYFMSDVTKGGVAAPSGIHGAISANGWQFDPLGFITSAGGVPGSLLFPDGSIHLYLGGNGIFSMSSPDGIHGFSFDLPNPEIPNPSPSTNQMAANPNPTPMSGVPNFNYIMSYGIFKKGGGNPALEEIHVAFSQDGLHWDTKKNPNILYLGSMPGIVERDTNTLFIYFVDFHTTQ